MKQKMQEFSDAVSLFLTSNIHGLRQDFSDLSSITSTTAEGVKRTYWEHRQYIHEKSLNLFNKVNNGELAAQACNVERGLLMYSLQSIHQSSSPCLPSTKETAKQLNEFTKLEEQAVACMRGKCQDLSTQQNLVGFLMALCMLINQDDYTDDYQMACNAEMYIALLLQETNELIRMINSTRNPEGKQDAVKMQKYSKKLLEQLENSRV